MANFELALFAYYKNRYLMKEKSLTDHFPVVAHGWNGEPYYYDKNFPCADGKGYANGPYNKLTPDIAKAGSVLINKLVSKSIDYPTGFDPNLYSVHEDMKTDKRPRPGDIIAHKAEGHGWTNLERRHFLIVPVTDLDRPKIEALCEPYYDITGSWDIGANPTDIIKKRRFCVPLADLDTLGVNTVRMFDRHDVYTPAVSRSLGKTDFWDKLKGRIVSAFDGLNMLEPKKGLIS